MFELTWKRQMSPNPAGLWHLRHHDSDKPLSLAARRVRLKISEESSTLRLCHLIEIRNSAVLGVCPSFPSPQFYLSLPLELIGVQVAGFSGHEIVVEGGVEVFEGGSVLGVVVPAQPHDVVQRVRGERRLWHPVAQLHLLHHFPVTHSCNNIHLTLMASTHNTSELHTLSTDGAQHSVLCYIRPRSFHSSFTHPYKMLPALASLFEITSTWLRTLQTICSDFPPGQLPHHKHCRLFPGEVATCQRKGRDVAADVHSSNRHKCSALKWWGGVFHNDHDDTDKNP